jgi:hypothetical protein
MARRATVAVLAAALLPALTAAATVPNLRVVSSRDRHVVALFALGDLAPGEIAIASDTRTGPDGAFRPASVKLREWMAPRQLQNGLARWRTRHVLRPGVYYVEVSGLVTETDCKPGVHPCREDWSAMRRVVVQP